MKNLLRKFVWYLIGDQVESAIAEFDEDLHDALFGSEECGIESAIKSLVLREISDIEIWVEDMIMSSGSAVANAAREVQA